MRVERVVRPRQVPSSLWVALTRVIQLCGVSTSQAETKGTCHCWDLMRQSSQSYTRHCLTLLTEYRPP